ncbi:protein of unknown function (plasmid) [Caballeronia sp. S22]
MSISRSLSLERPASLKSGGTRYARSYPSMAKKMPTSRSAEKASGLEMMASILYASPP